MKATAWLLTLDGGLRVAVGERELMHIISEEVERSVVPGAPAYARELILWHNRLLPLFDVAAALHDQDAANEAIAQSTQRRAHILVVAGYQVSTESQIEFGVLPVCGLPERIDVTEDSGCELPSAAAVWRTLAHSCFQHPQHGAVPILNLRRMFAPAENRVRPLERSAIA